MATMTDPATNHEESRRLTGYVPRPRADDATYRALGFRCGLEVHQQLATSRKLFCRCPTRRYQAADAYDAQLVRHMRPTLSELGEYDGTALMEFKTKKNIIYRIQGDSACTYDIDDTPPFPLNRSALQIALQIALLLETSIVGELHVTRKQYLDGSIPTGFQRTAIVGIDGEIPLGAKRIGIRQLSLEEDSCREVSDRGHERIYTTDRLGTPLVETVTEPELLTPDEAAAAADYLRYLARSTGQVFTGIGAAREDVNVSIKGGTRVEIKGVQHIRWIPELTHNEGFRQKALLEIRGELGRRIGDPDAWTPRTVSIDRARVPELLGAHDLAPDDRIQAVVLPGFAGILSFFTSPGRCFADELSDRVQVIACIERPNLAHPEAVDRPLPAILWNRLLAELGATDTDGLVLVWGSARDLPTALETIDERCRWAFVGVPNETRRALPDGTTRFERILPGPDRMYPDTDSAPIPIEEGMIKDARRQLPGASVAQALEQLEEWKVPRDAHRFILRRNLLPLLRALHEEAGLPIRFAARLVGQVLRHATRSRPLRADRLVAIARQVSTRGLAIDILEPLIEPALADLDADLDRLLERIGYRPHAAAEVADRIERLHETIALQSLPPDRARDRIMGELRPMALGNVALSEVAHAVEERLR